MQGELPSHIRKKINSLEEPYIKFVFALPRGKSETNTDLPTSKLLDNQLQEINSQLELIKNNPYHQISIDKAQNIKISSVRDIGKFLSLTYSDVSYRVVLINEAQNMNIDSQNALLKNLEEPPEGVVFILHSSNPQLLLSTIYSRCQEVKFNPLNSDDVKKILSEHFKYEDQNLDMVSKFSDGSVINAQKLLENDLESFLEQCIDILRYALARRYQTAFNHFDKIVSEWGNEGFYIVLDFIIKWFLDAIRKRNNLDMEYYSAFSETIEKFNSRYFAFNPSELINKLEALHKTKYQNINLNICVSNVIFEIGCIGIGN
jgi:DNA polymerase-3 subunit delta'